MYASYRECPRKWYIKYVLGLTPMTKGKALLFGGAIHQALAQFYVSRGNLEQTIETFKRNLEENKALYEKGEDFSFDRNRGPLMLTQFAERFQPDFELYDIIEVENEHVVWFGPGDKLRFTVRPDKVFRHKGSGVITPVESKTTSYSVTEMFTQTELDDQVTSYIWALNREGWACDSCLIDVLYNRKSVIDCVRPGSAFRSKGRLAIFEMGLYSTIIEVTQKYLALKQYPWPLIFPPYKVHCKKFGCEYLNVCDTNIKPGEVPPFYQKDSWERELDQQILVTQGMKLEDLLNKEKG